MQCPKRKRVADVELGIQVINEIQPAILQRTAVGFNLAESERIERATILGPDLNNHLVLIASFFNRDHFCGKPGHLQATLLLLVCSRALRLLLDYQNGVLCCLRHSEFNDRLCRNLDLLQRLRVDAGARFPFLLHELAKARQDELVVLVAVARAV
jgi:hypothetical protein